VSARVVVVGNRRLARDLLRHLLEEEWDVVGALAPEGDLAAAQANFVPLEELTADADCSLHETTDINVPETRRWLEDLEPDVCLCGGWSQIIDEEILKVPERGFLGLHSSRLPGGRGGAPVNWSLIEGADTVWISLFYYVPGVDAGDVVARGSVSVESRDDIETVFNRLAVEACHVVESVRRDLEAGSVEAEPQTLAEATYRPRRQPQDGLINWARSPVEQYNWVRAQTDPYPGAYTFHDGNRLTVWRASPRGDGASGNDIKGARVGEVLDIVDGEGVDVRTGDGVVRLLRVQAGNRPPQWADDCARAGGVGVGDCLGRHAAPESWYYTGIRGPSDPVRFETNLTDRDRGAVDVVSYSGAPRDLTVRAALDGEAVFETSTTVAPEYRERIEYAPTEPGTHTLTVVFEFDGKRVDTRHLKIFVGE